jgi:hypothetical protein
MGRSLVAYGSLEIKNIASVIHFVLLRIRCEFKPIDSVMGQAGCYRDKYILSLLDEPMRTGKTSKTVLMFCVSAETLALNICIMDLMEALK